jgi:hypothetical protein
MKAKHSLAFIGSLLLAGLGILLLAVFLIPQQQAAAQDGTPAQPLSVAQGPDDALYVFPDPLRLTSQPKFA